MKRSSQYWHQRRMEIAHSGDFELTEPDRRVVRALAAGVHGTARDLAKALDLRSVSGVHISLHRLRAKGIVLVEHDTHGSTRLAPDIVVIKDEVFRLIPIGTP